MQHLNGDDLSGNSGFQGAAVTRETQLGEVITPHMAVMTWSAAEGWHGLRVRPYGPLSLEPTASVLHYGQAVFEGLKAYRQADGTLAVFRPHAAARRMGASARRMAMPEPPEHLFLAAVDSLVEVDGSCVPDIPEVALYLRPVLFADEPALGLRPARRYQFAVVASPASPFRTPGGRSARVWISTTFSRVAPGGTGTAKFAGNYAAGFLAQQRAVEEGCDQVVWLDARSHHWIEEMGGMNIFFVSDHSGRSTLITPPLGDTVLPGVTRDCVLTLAADLGYGVEERQVSVEEWRDRCADGSISESFATGTNSGVLPIGWVRGEEGGWLVGDGGPGPVTTTLRSVLTEIQQGRRSDVHGWMHAPRSRRGTPGAPA